jgi:hypothetical protein
MTAIGRRLAASQHRRRQKAFAHGFGQQRVGNKRVAVRLICQLRIRYRVAAGRGDGAAAVSPPSERMAS